MLAHWDFISFHGLSWPIRFYCVSFILFLPSSSFTIGFFLLLGLLSKMGINTIQSLKTKNKNFLHSHCPTHHFHYLTFNCLLGFTLYCSLNFLFLIFKIYELVIFVVGFTFYFYFFRS